MLPPEVYSLATVNADPYSLANIADFNTLIARSQEQNVPIFELTDAQLKVTGPILKNMAESRDKFKELFEKLADAVIMMTERAAVA